MKFSYSSRSLAFFMKITVIIHVEPEFPSASNSVFSIKYFPTLYIFSHYPNYHTNYKRRISPCNQVVLYYGLLVFNVTTAKSLYWPQMCFCLGRLWVLLSIRALSTPAEPLFICKFPTTLNIHPFRRSY